jgi:hypothetical protein
MTIAKPPLNKVTGVEISYDTILQQARGGPEQPYPIYEFGNGRKVFWSNFETNGIYDKPVTIEGGITTHLPDPDFESTNP